MLFLKNHWKRCTLAAIIVLLLSGIGYDYFGHHFKSTDVMELAVGYYHNGFAPTPEQLETYLMLRAELHESVRHGYLEDAAYFRKRMDAIIKIARGKVPSLNVHHSLEGCRITEADRLKFLRKEIESGRYQKKLDQAYRDYGLEHLIGVNVDDAYPMIQPTIPETPRPPKFPKIPDDDR